MEELHGDHPYTHWFGSTINILLYICSITHLSTDVSLHAPIHLFIFSSFNAYIHLSIHQSTYSPIHPSIHLPSYFLKFLSYFFNLLFFLNNRTILLNIWMYLFCTTRISFFPLHQEASALEPHVYKNTLWQLLWQGEKSAILKVTTHNQSGEQKKAEVSGPSAAHLLSRGNNLRIETLEHYLSSTAQLSW